MNERLHRVLDGELARDTLSVQELAELNEAEALISGVLGSVPTRALPDLGPNVLSQLQAYPAAAAGGRGTTTRGTDRLGAGLRDRLSSSFTTSSSKWNAARSSSVSSFSKTSSSFTTSRWSPVIQRAVVHG